MRWSYRHRLPQIALFCSLHHQNDQSHQTFHQRHPKLYGSHQQCIQAPPHWLAVRYLHIAKVSSTKSVLMKSIHMVNYLICLLLTIINVNKLFSESEERQKVRMKNQCQGVRFTKPKEILPISGTNTRSVTIPVDSWDITAVGLDKRKISPINGTSIRAAQILAEIENVVTI